MTEKEQENIHLDLNHVYYFSGFLFTLVAKLLLWHIFQYFMYALAGTRERFSYHEIYIFTRG